MAWLYERGGRWWIGYRHNGKQFLRSTKVKVADRAEAQKQLEKVEMMFGHSRAGTLTDELFQVLTGSGLPKITLVAELDGWLASAQPHTESNTHARYRFIADEFKAFLNATDHGPLLSAVTSEDITGYLNEKRKTTAASTTNVARKILAGFFKRSVVNGRLRLNPVSATKQFKTPKVERVDRRAFTLEELQTIYQKAPDDFWRYMIVGGAYTGLRMGDLVCMKWGAVDLQHDFLTIRPDKTEDKEIPIPIAKPFLAILAALKAKSGKVKSSDFIWPEQAAKHARYKSRSGYFSNQFFNDILVPAELVTARPKSHKAKEGGAARRQMNEVSFHCLRHYFISRLKSTGSNQSVAKALAGHSSDQVNDLYTHVDAKELTKAISQLPEFVK